SAPDPESLRGASVRNTPILLAMALAPVARPLTAPADSAIIAAASGSLGRENRRSRCPLPAIRGNCPFTQEPRGGTSMRFPFAASVLSILTLPLAAQNALQHYDGTTEFTSRGASGTAAKTLLQRIPMDQACGRTAIASLTCTIQDQSAVTPESFTIEVRSTDPAGPPTGAPDMSPAGLIASVGPTPITFPGTGVSAPVLTNAVAFAPGVPAGDIYIGLAFPAAPGWTADGISIHCSAALSGLAGEQMRATAIGYTGVAGLSGLGWDSAAGGPPALGSGNRSWNLR